MEIKDEHKKCMKDMGLSEKDFGLFDGQFVKYEYDKKKGVRIYDPTYATSYNEYIDISGWSAWSSESDTFMSDILKPTHEEVRRRESISSEADQKEITESLKKKFAGKRKDDSEE